MPDRRRDAERAQRTHTADAENDFLLDACLTATALQARGQLAIPRRILGEVGVEQEQADAATPHPRDGGQHGALTERNSGDAWTAIGGDRGFNRRVGPADLLVAFFLPA